MNKIQLRRGSGLVGLLTVALSAEHENRIELEHYRSVGRMNKALEKLKDQLISFMRKCTVSTERSTSVLLGIATYCAFGFTLSALSSCAWAEKPGVFIIGSSLNDPLCRRARDLLNKDIFPTNKAGRAADSAFVEWTVVKNLDKASAREVDVGDLDKTTVDIDNDGQVDRIFRWKASLGGTKAEKLFIFSASDAKNVGHGDLSLRELFSAPRQIFINGSSWIQSVQKKYTSDWESWTAGFISTLEVFRHGAANYVLAFTPEKKSAMSSEAIVLQLLPGDEAKGVCMLRRVCPCSGCKDLRPQAVEQVLPSNNWCKP